MPKTQQLIEQIFAYYVRNIAERAALLGYKGLIVWGRHYDNLQGQG